MKSSGKIIECNQSTERIFGCERDELIGTKRKFLNMIRSDQIPFILEREKKLLSGKDVPIIDVPFSKNDGDQIWISVQSTLITIKSEKYIQLIANDITKRKRVEKQLELSKEKYRQAFEYSKLLKDVFSHDVDNIFQIILSSINLLDLYTKGSQGSDEIEVYNLIKDQIQRGSNLVSNINILSKLENSKISLSKVNLVQLLKDLSSSVQKKFENKSINIEINSFEDGLVIKANEFLEAVFRNILLNSIEHNNRSPIVILINITEKRYQGNTFVQLDFTDNGKGIEQKQKEQILNQNLSYKNHLDRTGLGFLIIKKVVLSLSGKIMISDTIENEPSRGTKLTICLPRGF